MSPTAAPGGLNDLQEQWSALYKDELPRLAKARNNVQPKWPVYLDHCFARIILDNAVGKDKPWTECVRAPATRNMSEAQFRAALELGRKIASGEASLDDLNQRSRELRGKEGPKRKRNDSQTNQTSSPLKRQRKDSGDGDIRNHFFSGAPKVKHDPHSPELVKARDTIASSKGLTPFRQFALILLTYIPRGRYSTYGAMSSYITTHHHKCSARAIGNAMRNNPFAPTVPCHRVLAHDGRIGGFCGDWGDEGKHAAKKKKLLAEEGVKFDSRGKVVGKPYTNFEEDVELGNWYKRLLGSSRE